LEEAYYDEKDDVTLIISIDFGGNPDVLKLAKEAAWTHGEKRIRTFNENQGLKRHLIQCGDYSEEYGAAIIFEDDIMPAPYFYRYVQQALGYYWEDDRIFAIALYSQGWNGCANRLFEPINRGGDVYLSQVACTWGECLIGDRWRQFKEWFAHNDGRLEYSYDVPHAVYYWKHSWGKYLLYYIASHKKYYVTPYLSLSTNFNNSGVHIASDSMVFQRSLLLGEKEFRFVKFDDAVKYDTFGESIELKNIMEKKYQKKVCIDYYGTRRNHDTYDLCLSSVLLPYKVVESYGLQMYPYELNYLYNIQGEDLYIYDLKNHAKQKRDWRHHYHLVQYEVRLLSWVDSLFYTLYQWLLKVKGLFGHR